MFYLVTYDFDRSKQDHTAFFDKIKTLGAWMHYIDDTWVVSTNTYNSADDIFKALEPFIDKQGGYLLIAQLAVYDRQGWLPEEAWEWFDEHGAP